MSATMVFLLAWGALIVGHWSHSEPTITVKQVIEMSFALIVIAIMDSFDKTEHIAKGFAWLFLAAVLLRSDSVLTGLAKASGTGTQSAPDVGATLGTPTTLYVTNPPPQPARSPVQIRTVS
jgi:hypothetical protein